MFQGQEEQRKAEVRLSDEIMRIGAVTGGGMFGKWTNVAKGYKWFEDVERHDCPHPKRSSHVKEEEREENNFI